ncbi:MAG TPA: YqhA family protein [Candidatus Dormibacteraeota bacterium]|nr:YqhA family protein [Candidatus Dormibacteraeota bacterium]
MKAERLFEGLLWRARLFVLIPVVFTLLAAIVASVEGAVVVTQGIGLAVAGRHGESTLRYLNALDTFLFATILYVASIGLYELFVSKLDDLGDGEGEARSRLPAWMVIGTLDDLKQKVASVVTIIIAISYLEQLSRWADGRSDLLHSALDVLWLSLGVAVAMVSLILFTRRVAEHQARPDEGASKGSPL